MPRLSIYFIRTALIYLLAGFTAGGLLLIQKGTNVEPQLWLLLPLHIEWMLIGWIFQLAMGVAFWILPRFPQEPVRGNEAIVLVAYLLINLGILIILAESFFQLNGLMAFMGRLSEAAAIIFFAIHAWPRVRAFSG